MKTINENKICDTHKCNNYVELGLPSTETKCPDHRVIEKQVDPYSTDLLLPLSHKEWDEMRYGGYGEIYEVWSRTEYTSLAKLSTDINFFGYQSNFPVVVVLIRQKKTHLLDRMLHKTLDYLKGEHNGNIYCPDERGDIVSSIIDKIQSTKHQFINLDFSLYDNPEKYIEELTDEINNKNVLTTISEMEEK